MEFKLGWGVERTSGRETVKKFSQDFIGIKLKKELSGMIRSGGQRVGCIEL